MSDEPTNQQPINDDQELAKVLAGVTAEANDVPESIVTTPAPAVVPEPVVLNNKTQLKTPLLQRQFQLSQSHLLCQLQHLVLQ